MTPIQRRAISFLLMARRGRSSRATHAETSRDDFVLGSWRSNREEDNPFGFAPTLEHVRITA
jgi:hypothetical protein